MSIAVLGGYGVGLTMLVDRAPHAGETVGGGRFRREHGGKGSNQAVAIARWGGSPALISAVGDDTDGASARGLWDAEGVDHRAVTTVSNAATMAGVIIVDGDGENRIAIAPGALDALTLGEEAQRGIAAADLLVISLELPLDRAREAVAVARAHQVPVLLNPAPAADVPDELWQSVDLLVPNQSEARALLGDPAIGDEDAARALAAASGARVVLTRGALGALVVERDGSVHAIAAPVVHAVDTTGAGDTFVGVLAAELVAGTALIDAVGAACAAAAASVEHPGVIDGIPHRGTIGAGAQR
jgi:ribokinase